MMVTTIYTNTNMRGAAEILIDFFSSFVVIESWTSVHKPNTEGRYIDFLAKKES